MNDEELKKVYEHYIYAKSILARHFPIRILLAKDLVHTTLETPLNPYLVGDWTLSLARSLAAFGTHFIYLVKNGKVYSGNHGIQAIKYGISIGLFPEDYKILAIDITSVYFPPTKVLTYKCTGVSSFNLEPPIVSQTIESYQQWTHCFIYLSRVLTALFFEYKERNGNEYPAHPAVRNQFILKDLAILSKLD
jgi:hypothetical protein